MKKRKILTKLGIIFGIIDLLLILFGVIFLKPKQVLAETPDSFLMNEIYLYNRNTFNLNPNFENDYLMKSTILPSDVESDNTSGLLGWYKNLGYTSLIKPYYGDDDNLYVTFAIPLNGILAVNFQLAYNVSSPTLLDFYLLFDDGTRQEWDTEQTGFGSRILVIDNINLNKNCYAFCWEAYSPDYIPSFKFLGVTEGYNIGYQNGETAGFERGNQLGYNAGYNAGLQDGLARSDEIIYDTIIEFNQHVKNGDFSNNLNNWSVQLNPLNFSVYDEKLKVMSIPTQSAFTRNYQQINCVLGHQYLLIATGYTTGDLNANYVYFNINYSANYPTDRLTFLNESTPTKKMGIYTATQTTMYVGVIVQYNNDDNAYATFDNIMLIDLTNMYGEGYEPTIQMCREIFIDEYYEYTTGTALDIGYFTGYYEGKNEGIQEGINIGETNQINMSWIQSIFQAMQGFFNIQIFPHVTLGIIVGIPFIISLAWFVIKMFRGGGGGED